MYWFYCYSCAPDAEVTPLEEVAPTIDFVTSEEALNGLLVEAGLEPATLSRQGKMNFLSDHLASGYLQGSGSNGRTASTDQIVCVAQIFDGQNYLTDVETGLGHETVRASSFLDLLVPGAPQGFLGANANVYRNGVNIGGRIASSFSRNECQSTFLDIVDYFATANANYFAGVVRVNAAFVCLDEADAD